MAGSVNRVILVGNLGKDPDVRHAQNGNKIVNMSVAVSESWVDKNSGERKEKVEWIRCVVFDERLADVAEKYLKKGAKVYLEGSLQTRKWVDQSGVEKFTTEVVLNRFRSQLVMLDGKRDGGEHEDNREPARGGGGGEFNNDGNTNKYDDLYDDIPFVTRWGLR